MNGWIESERLHLAAQSGDLAEVQMLLDQGRPVNEFDSLGMTPLHYAAAGEYFEVVQTLLRSGADVNAHYERMAGNTPLAEVVPSCSLRMAKVLLDAGADPTIPGWMQMSALDQAERRKQQRGERTGGDGQAIFELLRKAARKKRK